MAEAEIPAYNVTIPVPRSYQLAKALLRGSWWDRYLRWLMDREWKWNPTQAQLAQRWRDTDYGRRSTLRESCTLLCGMDNKTIEALTAERYEADRRKTVSAWTVEDSSIDSAVQHVLESIRAPADMSVQELHERAENFLDLMQVDPSAKNIRAAEQAMNDLESAASRMAALDDQVKAIEPLVTRPDEPYCSSCYDYTLRSGRGVTMADYSCRCYDCARMAHEHSIAKSFEVPPAVMSDEHLRSLIDCPSPVMSGVIGSYGPIWTEGVGVVIAG